MADELNIPTHRWYEARNHIKLPPNTVSKKWIYANGVALIDAWINSQPWGNLSTELFANGEPGFTFEPWDITTLYQDRAGTTPVTAAGHWVGLRLDKSKQTYFEPRRNLLTYTEQFNNAAWTKENITVTENTAIAPNGTTTATKIIETTATAEHKVFQPQTVLANTNYTITCYMKAGERTKAYIRDGWATGFNALFDLSNGTIISSLGGTASITSVGNGWYRCQFVMSTTATTLRPDFGPANAANSRNYTGDGISGIYIWGAQLELGSTATAYQATAALPVSWLGNHQVAINDAARGIYGWMPKTGKRNLLTYTEQFDNAAWSKANATVTANYDTDPDGSITADRFVSSGGSFPQIFQTLTLTAGQAYTFSAWVKSDGTSQIAQALLLEGVATAFTPTGTWTRVSVSIASSAGGSRAVVVATNSPVAAASSFLIWGAQLELGSTATAYQRVASHYDITEAGVPTCYYVQADGVDDAYVTPTITPNTDKAQVFAGVRKLSDSPAGHILGGNGNNSGHFETLSSGWMNTANRYGAGFYTNILSQIDSPASFAPPRADVLSWRFDMSGATGSDKVKLNVRGIPQTLSILGVPAQGNFGAFAHSIYSRSDGTLPFNGLDFGHAVRFGPNLDAATIARVESLIARNTPEVTL